MRKINITTPLKNGAKEKTVWYSISNCFS